MLVVVTMPVDQGKIHSSSKMKSWTELEMYRRPVCPSHVQIVWKGTSQAVPAETQCAFQRHLAVLGVASPTQLPRLGNEIWFLPTPF